MEETEHFFPAEAQALAEVTVQQTMLDKGLSEIGVYLSCHTLLMWCKRSGAWAPDDFGELSFLP